MEGTVASSTSTSTSTTSGGGGRGGGGGGGGSPGRGRGRGRASPQPARRLVRLQTTRFNNFTFAVTLVKISPRELEKREVSPVSYLCSLRLQAATGWNLIIPRYPERRGAGRI